MHIAHLDLIKKEKDSYKFMTSGASRVIISSSKQWAVVNNIKKIEPSLEELFKIIKKRYRPCFSRRLEI